MEFEILRRYREDSAPKNLTKLDDKPISVLKREELLEVAERREISLSELCKIGAIEDKIENWIVLVHYAIVIAKEKTLKRPLVTNDQDKSDSDKTQSGKKQKMASVTMEELRQEVGELKKQLEERQSETLTDNLERARREAKIEASQSEMVFNMPNWEKNIVLPFNPQNISERDISYVNYRGDVYFQNKNHISAEQLYDYAKSHGDVEVDLSLLRFYNPNQFVSGFVHSKLPAWKHILSNDDQHMYLDWIENGVRLQDFMTPFHGKFWGKTYKSDIPSAIIFPNANKCKKHIEFINDTILERLQNGSIFCKGRVGECQPPLIVSPLTVEPDKPRLCLNLMYLNNWTKDIHFTLDTLKDIPGLVRNNAFFTSLDDKSGFDNIKLHPDSYSFVGFEYAGYYFCFRTLVFGFKLSSYIYHTLNLQVVSYIRKHFSFPIFLYIDDRLVEEVRDINIQGEKGALLANYITCDILVRLGYFINLKKSVFQATQTPVHLGFIVDSVQQCFRITDEKKVKFIKLRNDLLKMKMITVQNLQKFAGRAISLMIAIPAAKLYTREVNRAISHGIIHNRPVQMYDELHEELCSWKFFDNWTGKLLWKNEKHITLKMFTDSSKYKYGGVVFLDGGQNIVSDFWEDKDRNLPIMVLEGYALLNVLKCVKQKIAGTRVDAYIDNMVLLKSWENEGCKSQQMNVLIKQLFSFVFDNDIILNLHYTRSKDNLADAPSRSLKKCDSMLSKKSWKSVQQTFGGVNGHSVDLMSLDSNCMLASAGTPLKHFSPWPTPLTAGVNMFEQEISAMENSYVFPPFPLVTSVLKFIVELGLTCTVIVPLFQVTPVWMPIMLPRIMDAFLLGGKGAKGVIMVPTKKGFVLDNRGLPVHLWAIRICPRDIAQEKRIPYGKLMLLKTPTVGLNFYLLCIGNSMIRFLQHCNFFKNPMVHVHSVSGGLVCQIYNDMIQLVRNYPPRLIFIHVGVNNMSKCFLYPNELTQMKISFEEFDILAKFLKTLPLESDIILSSIVPTRDGIINNRALRLNKYIKEVCLLNEWTYMDNSSVKVSDLRDTVHLNHGGEYKFIDKLLETISDII